MREAEVGRPRGVCLLGGWDRLLGGSCTCGKLHIMTLLAIFQLLWCVVCEYVVLGFDECGRQVKLPGSTVVQTRPWDCSAVCTSDGLTASMHVQLPPCMWELYSCTSHGPAPGPLCILCTVSARLPCS